MSRFARRAGGALVAVALLVTAGCAGSGPVTPLPPDELPPPPGTGPAPSFAPGDLAAQRRAAGIADCPTTSADTSGDLPPSRGLPDLTLDCLGGGSSTRLAGWRPGKPAVINVWAQWCGPCRQEAPILAELSRDAGDRIAVLGIDYDDPRPDLAIEFARRSGWHYPQLVDPQRRTSGVLGVRGVPHTVFVRADGTIAAQHPGVISSRAQLVALTTQAFGVEW